MKKITAILTACLLVVCLFTACGEQPDEPTSVSNPMVGVTKEQVVEKIGAPLGEVSDAENVTYFIIGDEIGEMQFDSNGVKITARIKLTAEAEDISGVYYEWDSVTDESVSYCDAKLMTCTDNGKTLQLCTWFDVVPGISYSVFASGEDLSGFDILGICEQVFTPIQGES